MPILFLGFFDTVFQWVYDKILAPIKNFIADIFDTIVNYVLKPILKPIFDALWDYIFSYVADFIFAQVYAQYVRLLDIVNALQGAFDVLIGVEDITYSTTVGTQTIEHKETLLNYVVFSDGVSGAITYITLGAIALTFVFAVYSVIRSVLDFDFENKRPIGKILGTMLKTMIAFAIVPLIVWAGINLSSVLLRTTVAALGDDGSASIADNILLVSSLDAGIKVDNVKPTYKPGSDDAWSKMLSGEYSYYTFGVKIHVSEIDYVVGFSSCVFCIFIMLSCLFVFIRRIYDVALLYLVSPYFTATMVLDDGQKFAQWREMFIGKVLSGFGAAISMRLYIMMVPIIMSDNIRFFEGDGIMVGAGDYVMKLVFLLGGMYAIYKSSSLLTQIISGNAARDEHQDMMLVSNAVNMAKERIKQSLHDGNKPKSKEQLKQQMAGMSFDKPIAAGQGTGQGFTGYGQPMMGTGYGYFPIGFNGQMPPVGNMPMMGAGNGDMSKYPSSDETNDNNYDKETYGDLSDEDKEMLKQPAFKASDELNALDDSKSFDDAGLEAAVNNNDVSFDGESSSISGGELQNNGFSGGDLQKNGFSGNDQLAEFRSCTGGIGMINVGGGSYAMPFGYTAFPKVVPRSEAMQQLEKMRNNNVPGLDEGFYNSVQRNIENGGEISYSDGITDETSAFTSYGGLSADVGNDYVVIPEIMRTDIAYDTAIELAHGNDSNSGFYANYAEHMASSGYGNVPGVFNYEDRSAVPIPTAVRNAAESLSNIGAAKVYAAGSGNITVTAAAEQPSVTVQSGSSYSNGGSSYANNNNPTAANDIRSFGSGVGVVREPTASSHYVNNELNGAASASAVYDTGAFGDHASSAIGTVSGAAQVNNFAGASDNASGVSKAYESGRRIEDKNTSQRFNNNDNN